MVILALDISIICRPADGLWPSLSAQFGNDFTVTLFLYASILLTGWLGGYFVAYRWVVGQYVLLDIGRG